MYTCWSCFVLLFLFNHDVLGMNKPSLKRKRLSRGDIAMAAAASSHTEEESVPADKHARIHQPLRDERAGMQGVCGKIPLEIRDVIAIFKDREKYERMGAGIPSGLLMVGMPGVGKTHMARKIAEELGFEMVEANAAQFEGPHPGDAEENIERLFSQARALLRKSLGVILFIDEFDALGSRENLSSDHQWYKQTITTLLKYMDEEHHFPILAATNKTDDIDPAFKRPGRLDRIIEITPPDREDREHIFKFYAQETRYDRENIDFVELAKLTEGRTPADIKFLVNEAAVRAVRDGADHITMDHYRAVIKDFSQRQKRVTKSFLREPEDETLIRSMYI